MNKRQKKKFKKKLCHRQWKFYKIIQRIKKVVEQEYCKHTYDFSHDKIDHFEREVKREIYDIYINKGPEK